MREDAVAPIHSEMNLKITRTSLNCMDERRTPLPGRPGLVTFPKSVQDRFGDTWAKRTRVVNVEINLLPPSIDSDGLVPDTPNKGCLFLSSFAAPNVLPVNRGVPRKDASPFGLAQVHRLLNIPDPGSRRFGGKLKQGDTSGPAESIRIKVQLKDGAVEEIGGKLLGATEGFYNSDLSDNTGNPILIIQVLFKLGKQSAIEHYPVVKVWNTGKGPRGRVDRVG